VGYHGAFPCHLYCGIKGRRKPGISHYYPALLKPNNYTAEGCDHPDVLVSSIQGSLAQEYEHNLAYLLHSCNPTDHKRCRKETGISQPSLLSGLAKTHSLLVTSSLAGDTMHIPTLNLGDLLPALWRGVFKCSPSDNVQLWDWAVLQGDVWKTHGEAVANARPYIHGSFDYPPHNIADKISSGYKAKEWQGYFFGLALALLYSILLFCYWQNFCKLVHAVCILHQCAIPHVQVIIAQQLLDEFYSTSQAFCHIDNSGDFIALL
jgi:hypothetical protein